MNATDEIQAAIDKLTVTSNEMAVIKAHDAWDAMLRNANLAERLWYATIDAQLSLMESELHFAHQESIAPGETTLALARAINEATS